MKILGLIIALAIFMGITSLVEEEVPFIKETFTAFILFLAVKISLLVVIFKLFLKKNLSVKPIG
jgi:hypothetical protein